MTSDLVENVPYHGSPDDGEHVLFSKRILESQPLVIVLCLVWEPLLHAVQFVQIPSLQITVSHFTVSNASTVSFSQFPDTSRLLVRTPEAQLDHSCHKLIRHG